MTNKCCSNKNFRKSEKAIAAIWRLLVALAVPVFKSKLRKYIETRAEAKRTDGTCAAILTGINPYAEIV